MEGNNKDVNLASISEVFNNKTFRYRINGFAHACKMYDVGVVNRAGVIFNTAGFDKYGNPKTSDEHSYFIAVNEGFDQNNNSVTLSGEHDDLHFVFTNYYHKEKLDRKIVDLPFSLSLEKKIDEVTYKMNIETIEKQRTKFVITKSCEFKDRTLNNNIVFYANILEFSTILKLVESFVYNPCLVFDSYSEMMEKMKVVFTTSMVGKVAMQDEELDKPCGKIKKLFGKIVV